MKGENNFILFSVYSTGFPVNSEGNPCTHNIVTFGTHDYQFNKQSNRLLLKNYVRNFSNPFFIVSRSPEFKNKGPIYEQKDVLRVFQVASVCQALPPPSTPRKESRPLLTIPFQASQ